MIRVFEKEPILKEEFRTAIENHDVCLVNELMSKIYEMSELCYADSESD